MSSQFVVGPLVTHVVSIDDPNLYREAPTMWPPVVARGTVGQERLAAELIDVLRSSFARYRGRRRATRLP